MKRRRLGDLYVRGKELKIDDGQGDPVVVWLQKLNGIDREACMRRSLAAKARFLRESEDDQGELYQSIYGQVRTMGDRDGLVRLIVAEDLAKFRPRAEAELALDEDGWGKDGYLQGLVDAWLGDDHNQGLAAVKAEDADDPEVVRVDGELRRFDAEVEVRVEAEERRLTKDWVDASDEEIWKRVTTTLLRSRADSTFAREYDRQQLFYCVRDPDEHGKRYFGMVVELDDLDESIYTELLSNYQALMVDSVEGKGSRASRPSSNSSGPSSVEEVQRDSGPQAANA